LIPASSREMTTSPFQPFFTMRHGFHRPLMHIEE
jgi:hypothetical protein